MSLLMLFLVLTKEYTNHAERFSCFLSVYLQLSLTFGIIIKGHQVNYANTKIKIEAERHTAEAHQLNHTHIKR